MKAKNKDVIAQNKIFVWMALATVAVLSVPLVAMQFTNEVDWKSGDFIIMGILLFGAGSLFVFIARITSRKYRTLIGVLMLIAVFLLWVHLAVGIVDTWPLAGS